MRRWTFRILAGIAILLLLIIVTVQIVLWTPLPRRIAVEQIEKALGLRISANSLSISWWGKTQLRDVSLGLPLSKDNFLKVSTLTIRHNTLIGLALGRAISVDSIEIDKPVVEVVQDADGKWNLQQVAELLAKAGGSNTAQQAPAGGSGVPKLPIIRLVDGSVHISDNQKHTLALQPLNVTGQPNGTLVWNYDASIADAVKLHGQLAPGGSWQHRVSLSIEQLDPLLKDWGVPTTYATAMDASWSGQFSDGKVTGTLTLDKATARGVPTLGDVRVDGSIDIVSAGAVLTLHPNKVNLVTTNLTLPNLGIQSGSIVSDDTGLHADAIKLTALGGAANLDGAFDPRTSAVDVHARWSGLSLAKQTSQSGSLTASLRQPFIGHPVIKVELNSSGTVGAPVSEAASPPGRWNADVTLTGQGSSWQQIDWVLAAPQLRYVTGSQAIDLSRTTAHVSQRLPVVELTDLSLPLDNTVGQSNSASFAGSGIVNFKSSEWKFDATAAVNASYQDSPMPVTLDLHAVGNKDRYNLKKFVVGVADVTVTADGSYDRSNPKPVDLHVLLSQEQRIVPTAPIQGEVSGKFDIRGLLFKDAQNHFRPYLSIEGDLISNDLVVLNRPVGDIDIKLEGTTATPMISADTVGPIKMEIHTTDFSLFQAPWNFTANYSSAAGVLEANLTTHNLAVEELARFAKMTGITGRVTDARWNAKITSPTLSGIDLQSDYHISKLVGAGLATDTIDANATLRGGVLQLSPLLARSGNGSVKTTASIDLKDPRHLVTETTVTHWPYPISAAVAADFNGHSSMDVDLHAAQIGATGSLVAAADVYFSKAPLAHMQIAAEVNKRMLAITNLKGNILSGTIDGSAAVDFDKPLEAVGRIIWNNVDGASLAEVFPAMTGAGGIFSGAITLAPARDPRPLEPVRMDVNVAAVGGHFRSLEIGGRGLLAMHAVAYLNTDRAVLDHSDLFLGGGVMHLWSRVDNRRGRGISTQAMIDFENIQLNELAHISPKLNQDMPGLLKGQIGLVRSGPHVSQLLGSAHVDLTNTDLVNFGPLTALYNLMNAAGGISKKPNGTGSLDLSFEQNVVRVSRFQFFNRGIDAHGLFNVGPISYDSVGKTPIGGQVVGAARALKGTRLPLLSDFDTLFTALSGQLTTVNVLGTINDPHYPSATLQEIGKGMRELLVGDAQAAAAQ